MLGKEFERLLCTTQIPVETNEEFWEKIYDDLNFSSDTQSPRRGRRMLPAVLDYAFATEDRRITRRRDGRIRGCERYWDSQDIPRSVALRRSIRNGYMPEDIPVEDLAEQDQLSPAKNAQHNYVISPAGWESRTINLVNPDLREDWGLEALEASKPLKYSVLLI